jgi:outer membrane protein
MKFLLASTILVLSACTKAPIQTAAIPAAQPKVAILDIQKAVTSTRDGKLAEAELHRKFDPTQRQFAQDQSEIEALRQQILNNPSQALQERFKTLTQTYNRHMEDARQKFEVEQKSVLKDLTAKLMVVAADFAKQNHFETILDGTNVLWRADQTDITDQVIALYDQRSLSTQISGKFR